MSSQPIDITTVMAKCAEFWNRPICDRKKSMIASKSTIVWSRPLLGSAIKIDFFKVIHS